MSYDRARIEHPGQCATCRHPPLDGGGGRPPCRQPPPPGGAAGPGAHGRRVADAGAAWPGARRGAPVQRLAASALDRRSRAGLCVHHRRRAGAGLFARPAVTLGRSAARRRPGTAPGRDSAALRKTRRVTWRRQPADPARYDLAGGGRLSLRQPGLQRIPGGRGEGDDAGGPCPRRRPRRPDAGTQEGACRDPASHAPLAIWRRPPTRPAHACPSLWRVWARWLRSSCSAANWAAIRPGLRPRAWPR